MSDTFSSELETNPDLATPRLRRQQLARVDATAPKLIHISGDEDYEKLAPGAEFVGPDQMVRTKPYVVSSDEDFDKVPEGAEFTDPKGEVRTKPKYEAVDFTTQALYDMALTEKEKMNVLERGYHGKIKKEGAELYIDDEGVRRKPGHAVLPKLAAEAAPMLGMVGAGLVGATGGTLVEPIGGTALGVAAMVPLGAMAGQSFNDMILQLAGVYDRTAMQTASNMAWSGVAAEAGQALPEVFRMVSPATRAAFDAFKGWAGRSGEKVSKFLGIDPERGAIARDLAKEGVQVPPSAHMMEAPYLHKTEVFQQAFQTQQPLRESAREYFEKKGGEIASDVGVALKESLTKATKKVSAEEAGEAVLQSARARVAQEDLKTQAALEAEKLRVRTEFELTTGERAKQIAALEQRAAADEVAAQDALNAAFRNVKQQTDEALKQARAGSNSGDLWWTVSERFKMINAGFKAAARKMYQNGDQIGMKYFPKLEPISNEATRFLRTLPENFRNRYPTIVEELENLVGSATANPPVPPVPASLGQLRNLRSSLRHEVDYLDLNIGPVQGAYKHFERVINEAIHNPNLPADVKPAVAFYDAGDRIYAKNAPAFRSDVIKSVMKGLEDGYPADPSELAKVFIQEGNTELLNKTRRMVGPNMWSAIAAADQQNMLNASKTLVADPAAPGEFLTDASKYAQQVLARHRKGLLAPVHRGQASEIARLAENIEGLRGELPIQVRPGDTVAEVIARSKASADAVKAEANNDPIGTLEKQLKLAEQRHAEALAKTRGEADSATRQMEFLSDPGLGPIEAAENILKRPDLYIAAAKYFGEESAEFTLLRQVAAQRILQQPIETVGRLAGQLRTKIEPRVWELTFPGVTQEQASILARNMEFLIGPRPGLRGAGSSIAAAERVLNPVGAMSGLGKLAGPVKIVPGFNTLARTVLAKYYQFLVWASSRPASVEWLTRSLEKGTVAEKEQARRYVQQAFSPEANVGAMAGEDLYQSLGAQQAPDGNYYVEDPDRPGKYLRVDQ